MDESNTAEPRKTLTQSVFRGLGWSYLSAGMYAVLQLAIVGVLSHILEPRAFGILGIALIFTNIAERIGQLGVGPALVQRERLDQDHIDAGYTMAVLLGATIALIFAIVAPPIASFFREPELVSVIRILSLIFIIDGFAVVADSTLQRELRFKDLAKIENISYFIGAGVIGIGGALLGFGIWALVGSQIALRIVRLILFRTLIPIKAHWGLKRQAVRDLLSKGFGFSAGRLLGFVALYGDNFIIGRMLGPAALGIYSRAYQLMTLPSTYVGQMADRVLFPALSNRQSDRQTMQRAMLLLIEVLALVSMPISMVMILAAPEIVAFLLGNNWGDAISVLQILSYGVFFRAGYKCGDTIARSVGEVYRHASIQGLYSICVVIGAFFGAHWGTSGVASGVLVAVAINYLAMSHLALRLVNLSWTTYLKAHLSGVWIALWIGLSCAFVVEPLRAFSSYAMVRLFCIGIVSALSAVIAWVFMPRFMRGSLIGYIGKHCPQRFLHGKLGPIIKLLLQQS